MKMRKTLKYLGIFVLVVILAVIGYVYSLTFTPYGRLQWGQALTKKLVTRKPGDLDAIKKMTLAERYHLADDFKVDDDENIKVDLIKITSDSLSTYIFKPKNITFNSPVIVYFHGGGFTAPWTNVSKWFALRLAKIFNYMVVAVDYRVAPEHPFPIPNNDCYATLKWTIENIAKYKGNPNKIIVAGESAGGTLAALTVQRAKTEGLSNIKYQILDCPVADFNMNYESYKNFKHGFVLEEEDALWSLDAYVPKNVDKLSPEVSPLRSTDLSGLPPAYIVTCEFDIVRDSGRAYAQKLKDSKVTTMHKEMKGYLHVMMGPFNQGDSDKLYDDIAEEAKKYVK